MNNTTNSLKNIATAIALIVIATTAFLFVQSWNAVKISEVKNNAINGCAEIGSQSDPSGAFNGAVYKICVEDKGYQTQIK